jgi:hypothetical protein
METLGSLCDKITIEIIRRQKMAEAGRSEELLVSEKVNNLKIEIDEYVYHASKGLVVLNDPKLKFYKNEIPSNDVSHKISDSIVRLSEANYTLWNLEDKRRDKSVPDAERLQVCDDVGKWNRIRNDAIDKINELFSKSINKT